jgi:predicted hotdog family 3-hydroxylacyl-ACP dehydratase
MSDGIDIAALIPHAGSMVLLESVNAWDADAIQCVACSHADAANPLRRDNCLPAICGVEYVGQAIALHGALLAGTKSRPGFLVSVRDVALHARRLDDAGRLLVIDAHLLARQPSGMSYRFSIGCDSRRLVEGRATIVLP